MGFSLRNLKFREQRQVTGKSKNRRQTDLAASLREKTRIKPLGSLGGMGSSPHFRISSPDFGRRLPLHSRLLNASVHGWAGVSPADSRSVSPRSRPHNG